MTPSRDTSPSLRAGGAERAALVGLITGPVRRIDAERSLDELEGLATTAGATVVLRVLQERERPDPGTFLGRGKIETLAAACEETDANVVIVDNELSGVQVKQIESRVGVKVIDRTQVILDIFALRARTREGKLQVELAQLKYLLPRLAGGSDWLSRLGGGIGTRGPGETKLEVDRRTIRHRISHANGQLEEVRRRRMQLRERRQKASVPTIALIGYTNAGKTSLFNLLAGDTAVASDALFVTLDTLVRRVRLPDHRELLVSDTVGFIDRLPHSLVAAFRATLEEVAAADLLLHVIDAASPGMERRMAAVRRTLEEVGAGEVRSVDVYNKCDLLHDTERERLQRREPDALFVSATTGAGRAELLDSITARLALDAKRATFVFNPADERDRVMLAQVYRYGRVIEHVERDGRVSIDADVPRRMFDGSEPRRDSMTEPTAHRRCRAVVALALLAALLAACAPKTTVPSVATSPRFPDFVYPAAPRDVAKGDLAMRQQRAWQYLQAGDLKASRREFTSVLQRSQGFYPADAGLAYISLAEKNYLDALARFDRVLVAAAKYAPALAGRGDALVGTGRIDEAVRSFQAALAADSSLGDVKRRLDVLALRTQQQAIAAARQATEAGRFDEAAAAYDRAIVTSPDSAFLYRELAGVERRQGRPADALQHVRKALTLDPSDARTYILLGELFEDRGDAAAAVDAFTKAQELEPGDETARLLARARASANSARLPEEYRAIPAATQITRGDLAALLGVRLAAFLQANAKADTRVVTDVRGHWAATWIMAVVRASVMEPYQNHAFTPRGVVRRVDLAQVVSRVLTLVAAKKPAQGRQWLAARPQMTDMPAGHLGYPAAAVAVGSGVMALDGSGFRPSRVVTGAEAVDVIGKLEVLVK